jgi:hypothetical protein
MLALGLAIVAAVIGANSAIKWRRMSDACSDAARTELAVFTNAFAAPGSFTADIAIKHGFACKDMLVVESQAFPEGSDDVEATLAGLRIIFQIERANGSTILDWPLEAGHFRPMRVESPMPGIVPVLFFRTLPAGNYRVELTVHEPAQVLVDVPHRVVLRYHLCGLEELAVTFSAGTAILAFLVSGIIALILILRRPQSVAPATSVS